MSEMTTKIIRMSLGHREYEITQNQKGDTVSIKPLYSVKCDTCGKDVRV